MRFSHKGRSRGPGSAWLPALSISVLGLSLTTSNALGQAQSSGSGAGTGTGVSGGAASNSTGTGLMGGPGFNPTGTGAESGAGPASLPSNNLMLPGAGRYYPPPPGPPPRIRSGEGYLPAQASGSPSPTIPGPHGDRRPGQSYSGKKLSEQSEVSQIQLDYARRIPAPGDRSLSLSRIASAATFSNQLELADTALIDASTAALQMQPGMVRDQRLISIITALVGLAEARLREGKPDELAPVVGEAKPEAIPAKPEPVKMIRLALADYRRAAELAGHISNPTYRSEMMHRSAENMAYGSQTIVNEYPRAEKGPDAKPGGVDASYEGLPDAMLQESARIASRCERTFWRDEALLRVATSAAESRQFVRALSIARLIPQPEVRANALLKVAELQARRGDPDGATSTYYEAAQSVASIVEADPRAVLAGVLIDNLVAVGRFEDARRSLVLYPDEPRRFVAMGAIAEQMGRRGASLAALDWINREAPANYRSHLYRRVNNGVVAAIELNRSRDLSARPE